MTTREQRERWGRSARWLAELGLASDEAAPVEVIEEVANGALALLHEVDVLERRLAWLSRAVSEQWPTLATDLTFARLGDGVVSTSMTHWEEDRPPEVGERILVSDGGPLMEAVVTAVEGDVLRLRVTDD